MRHCQYCLQACFFDDVLSFLSGDEWRWLLFLPIVSFQNIEACDQHGVSCRGAST